MSAAAAEQRRNDEPEGAEDVVNSSSFIIS
jgi:hypothetical protein